MKKSLQNILKKSMLLLPLLAGAINLNAQTYTFTNCGVIGMDGPTQGEVTTEYGGTSLNGLVTINTQGIQEWIVPTTGMYSIEARGAQGGYALTNVLAYGGSGAILKGEVMLTAGQTIFIAVGQYGGSSNVEFIGNGSDEGAGGGGSFVAVGATLATSTPLVVAGGGAGGTTYYDSYGFNASTSNTGVSGNTGGAGGIGGLGGDNGSAGGSYFSSGGAGFSGNGQAGMGGFGGTAFINGAIGGIGGNSNLGFGNSQDRIDGGFGGGGSARGNTHCGGGGGGGYSGGGAGGSDAPGRHGGGGGSFMEATAINVSSSDGLYNGSTTHNGSIVNLNSWNSGNGTIIITALCIPTSITPDLALLAAITGDCSAAMPTAPTASTNCGGSFNGVPDVTFPISTQGTTVVTWTYNDGSGNVTTQTQNIIITDTISPAPDSASLVDIENQCLVTSLTAPTATDNCSGAITGTHDATLPITAGGLTVVTWTFDDGNGNTSTQTQNVINQIVDVGVTETGGVLSADALVSGYQWLDCDSNYAIIPTEVNQTYAPSVTGNYAVEVTTNGCIDTSACILVDFSGFIELGSDQLTLYPNPSHDGSFQIEFDGLIESIQIVDMLGREIDFEFDLATNKVNTESIENGNYLVLIHTDKGTATRELILIK